MRLCTTFVTLPLMFFIAISSLSTAVDNPNARRRVSEDSSTGERPYGRRREKTCLDICKHINGNYQADQHLFVCSFDNDLLPIVSLKLSRHHSFLCLVAAAVVKRNVRLTVSSSDHNN